MDLSSKYHTGNLARGSLLLFILHKNSDFTALVFSISTAGNVRSPPLEGHILLTVGSVLGDPEVRDTEDLALAWPCWVGVSQ